MSGIFLSTPIKPDAATLLLYRRRVEAGLWSLLAGRGRGFAGSRLRRRSRRRRDRRRPAGIRLERVLTPMRCIGQRKTERHPNKTRDNDPEGNRGPYRVAMAMILF